MHVASTAIADIAYDPASWALYVTFAGEDRYRYADVPASVHSAVLKAQSKGRFVTAKVRDR